MSSYSERGRTSDGLDSQDPEWRGRSTLSSQPTENVPFIKACPFRNNGNCNRQVCMLWSLGAGGEYTCGIKTIESSLGTIRNQMEDLVRILKEEKYNGWIIRKGNKSF